jgi:hypothetical protein
MVDFFPLHLNFDVSFRKENSKIKPHRLSQAKTLVEVNFKMCCCSIEEYQQKLNRIQQLADELTFEIDVRSRLVISEHCKDVIRNIDIHTETSIQRELAENTTPNVEIQIRGLTELSKELIKLVDAYEAKCIKIMETTKSTLLANIDGAKKWSQRMRQPDALERFNEKFAHILDEQAENHLHNLRNLHLQLKGFRFAGKLLSYRETEYMVYYSIKRLVTQPLVIPSVIRLNFNQLLLSSSSKSNVY